MTWNPDDPFPIPLGETRTGARNLPAFLCSLLDPGPVLVLGTSEIVLAAAADHEVLVVDWNRRRLANLESCVRGRGRQVRTLCRNPDRQELGLTPRSLANVVCLDVLGQFRDPVGVLEKLHRTLVPGGRLVVRAPARARADGRARDDLPTRPGESGPESLRASLEEAAFRTLNLRYWNFVGVPASVVSERFPPSWPGPGVPVSEGVRHWWDGALDLWFRTVENRVGFPTGVSLVAVATPLLEKSRVRSEAAQKGFAGRRAREAYEPMATSR